jgi:hypothetical protein
VRVSKTEGAHPEELETPDSFPSGWGLVLSQDGGPAQAVGPKSGHIGDFRGLADGSHLLRSPEVFVLSDRTVQTLHCSDQVPCPRLVCFGICTVCSAWLADQNGMPKSAQASAHFFIGTPRPTINILFPTPGAVISNDPITVLFAADEFEVPGDGTVAVTLDGVTICQSNSHTLYHCDLTRVETGDHTVSVILIQNTSVEDWGQNKGEAMLLPHAGIPAASHSVSFAVRRPQVQHLTLCLCLCLCLYFCLCTAGALSASFRQVELVYPPPGAYVPLQDPRRLPRDMPAEYVTWTWSGVLEAGAEGGEGEREEEEVAALILKLTTTHIGDSDEGESRAQNALLLRIEMELAIDADRARGVGGWEETEGEKGEGAPEGSSFSANQAGARSTSRVHAHVLDWYVDRADHHVVALLLPPPPVVAGDGGGTVFVRPNSASPVAPP